MAKFSIFKYSSRKDHAYSFANTENRLQAPFAKYKGHRLLLYKTSYFSRHQSKLLIPSYELEFVSTISFNSHPQTAGSALVSPLNQ